MRRVIFAFSKWTRGTIATGVACCDGQAAWDTFGNLFLVYINNSVDQINVIVSTDGGATFSAPLTVGTGSIDQPSIAVGNGSVWVDWNSSGSMVARGAPVTGLGVWGPFNAQQAIPLATGSFGGIAVGPGPNGGKVIVTYQNPTGGQGPATIFANVDADGLGAGGFGARITVSATNVGGFDFIPAQSGRSIDAEAGVVWDATGGRSTGRTDATCHSGSCHRSSRCLPTSRRACLRTRTNQRNHQSRCRWPRPRRSKTRRSSACSAPKSRHRRCRKGISDIESKVARVATSENGS